MIKAYPKQAALLPLGEVQIPFKFLVEAQSCTLSTERLLAHLNLLPPDPEDEIPDHIKDSRVFRRTKELAEEGVTFPFKAVLEMWDAPKQSAYTNRYYEHYYAGEPIPKKAIDDVCWLLKELKNFTAKRGFFTHHRKQFAGLQLEFVDSCLADIEGELAAAEADEDRRYLKTKLHYLKETQESHRKLLLDAVDALPVFLGDWLYVTCYGCARILGKMKTMAQAKSIEECRKALADMPAATQTTFYR